MLNAWRISGLDNASQFADTVASRGWNAWWTTSGVPLEAYRAHLEPMVTAPGPDRGFVAHSDHTYLGSVLLIANDLDARPQLTPWIAALWVDPPHRRQGIAASLMEAATQAAAAQGFSTVYLCAEPKVTPYYLAQGWTQLESDVGGLNVFRKDTLRQRVGKT